MSYKLLLKKVKVNEPVLGDKDYQMFAYAWGKPDDIDLENIRIMKKELGITQEIELYNKASTFSNVTQVKTRGKKLDNMYTRMIQLMFEYMMDILYETKPYEDKDGKTAINAGF